MEELTRRLEDLRDQGLYRRLRLISGPQGPRVVLDGTPVLLLCSNNFLGFSDHPRIREAAADAAMRWGLGAGGSRMISGSMTIHRRLEEALAGFLGTESALLFGSGSMAAAGVLQSLQSVTSVVAVDTRSHPAVIDACRATGLPLVPFTGDAEDLSRRLREAHAGATTGTPLIVTDAVFHLDGARADLHAIADVAQRTGARTVVNESYGLGCVGPGGRGAIAEAGLTGVFDVVIGSLGKALGAYGGFAAGEATLTRFLINHARSVMFSTAPAPPVVAGALASLELLQAQPERIERLRGNAAVLHGALADEGVSVPEPPSHIMPLLVGDATTATNLCERLLERRVFVQAIRPPAATPTAAGLRMTVSAAHTPQELKRAARAIAETSRELGLTVAAGPARPSITTADDSLGEWSSAPVRASRAQPAPTPGGFFDVEQLDAGAIRASRGTESAPPRVRS